MKNLFLIIFILVIAYAFADELPMTPKTLSFYSQNNSYAAVSDVNTKITTVFKVNKKGNRTRLWEISGWHNRILVSNDGQYCVICYSGENLLPLVYKKDEIAFHLYKNGALMRAFRFNEIIKDFKKLQRTEWHYFWGRIYGLDNDIIKMDTVERPVEINIKTLKIQ
jgi:hypothetical protein